MFNHIIIFNFVFLIFLILIRWDPTKLIHHSNPVLLISMDGFRHDYIEKVNLNGGKTPNFHYLMKEGSRIMRIKNEFPTVTLPNHQTILTGLFPINHGIILNRFIEKSNNHKFEMNDQDSLNKNKWFDNWPEPIWVTLEKSGYSTASHLWPLTDSTINGYRPFFQESQYTILNYPKSIFSFMKRVEDTVYWLSETRVHIDFAMLYFQEPDETGHAYGPNSQNVYESIMKLDRVLGYLIKLMKSKNLWNDVNIILTADHGMSEVSYAKEIPLDDYVNPAWYTYIQLTPIGAIYPIKGKENLVYNSLKNKNVHLEVYWINEVPTELHFNINNGRIPPLILIAENLWTITHKKSNKTTNYGDHGYKSNELDSHSFLIAHGPNIKKNFKQEYGYSVDIYGLMCHLLKIKPNPNNGSFNRIRDILEPEEMKIISEILFFIKFHSLNHVIFIECLVLIISISGFFLIRNLKKHFTKTNHKSLNYNIHID